MRPELAEEILGCRDVVADAVTGTFLARHPDWLDRYGERARLRGVEDARHHIDFVAAAIEIDDPASFADYARWCRGVLESRGIDVRFLVENLEDVGAELGGRLSADAAVPVETALRAGLAALSKPPRPLRRRRTAPSRSPAACTPRRPLPAGAETRSPS